MRRAGRRRNWKYIYVYKYRGCVFVCAPAMALAAERRRRSDRWLVVLLFFLLIFHPLLTSSPSSSSSSSSSYSSSAAASIGRPKGSLCVSLSLAGKRTRTQRSRHSAAPHRAPRVRKSCCCTFHQLFRRSTERRFGFHLLLLLLLRLSS